MIRKQWSHEKDKIYDKKIKVLIKYHKYHYKKGKVKVMLTYQMHLKIKMILFAQPNYQNIPMKLPITTTKTHNRIKRKSTLNQKRTTAIFPSK